MKIHKDTRRNLQVSTIVLGFTTMLLMAVWSGQASAADVGKRIIDGVWHITYDGTVEVGDEVKFEAIVKENPDIEWVSFNSPGGSAQTGIKIGYVLDDYLMAARVREGNKCMSACANGFLSAHKYSVEGTLGFHSFRYAEYDGDGMTRIEKKEIRETVYYAQTSASLDVYNILLNGFSWDLHFDYVNEMGKFIEIKSNEELKKYYIGPMTFSYNFKNNNGDKEFVDFPKKKDKSSQTFSYGTSVKFKSTGTKTFHKNSQANGLNTKVYVDGSSHWITGRQVGVYTYIHTGKNSKGQTLAYGWVSTYLLKER